MGGGWRGTHVEISLLHLEASWSRISQFASKIAEERRRVVHMASSWRSHEDEAKLVE
jgi:hypothetical protein